MGDPPHQAATSSRLGMRGGGGEIVEVQGGHIVRSTGRKDRHSKVCTAKGPRDRRVRLSAHTAIQFYDVQDRLGYDRPSKAVDWLIKKAKAAIDQLAELPAWNPNTANTTAGQQPEQHQQNELVDARCENPIAFHRDAVNAISHRRPASVGADGRLSDCTFQNLQNPQLDNQNGNSAGFLPANLESAFPPPPTSTIQFQTYPPDMLSRTSSHSQDLRLSLQSFHDPMLLHHHQAQHQPQNHQNEHVLFSGQASLGGFDGAPAGWPEHQNHPAFQRMISWSAAGEDNTGNAGSGGHGGAGSGSGGFAFNSPPTATLLPLQPLLQPFFGDNQFFSQRGPLQSSNPPAVRAWNSPSIAAADHQNPHTPLASHQSTVSAFGVSYGGSPGFRFPARIQGEEEHDGISNKPSSASSDSRH